MKQRILKFAALSTMVSLGLVAAYVVAGPVAAQPGGGNCLEGGTKLDFSAEEYTINAPAGSVVTAVSIKAGRDCLGPFTEDFNDGCYAVSGLGTATVTIERIGSGPTCKEISHVEFLTSTSPPPTTTTVPTTTTTPTTSTVTTTP
jgi:hypothetical protein